MKAPLGEKVNISLPKAYQTAKPKMSHVTKRVPAEVTEHEFKEFLNLNKINYAKAERLTSKRDSRVLEMFKLETKDNAEAEALINRKFNLFNNRYYLQGGRISHFNCLYSSAGIGKVSAIRPKHVGPKPNVLYVGRANIIKDAQIKRKSSQNAPILKGHMLHPTKGVQYERNRHLCGGKPKVIWINSTRKLGSPTAPG